MFVLAILELELELIQSHMAQKPLLRGEVGCACVAREVSVERGGMSERGCARRLGGNDRHEKGAKGCRTILMPEDGRELRGVQNG